jgi:hypothetical protein
MRRLMFGVMLCVPLGAAAQSLDVSRYRLVDLTHSFNAQTVYWPTDTSGFKHEQLWYGPAR